MTSDKIARPDQALCRTVTSCSTTKRCFGTLHATGGRDPAVVLDLSARSRDLDGVHRCAGRSPGMFIGLENYISLFDDDVFWLSVFNTLIYTIVATIAKFGLGMWLALLLNHAIPFKAVIRAVVLLPFIVPTVLSAIAFWWIYDPQFSIVSWSLHKLGLIDTFHRLPGHSLECALVGDHCQCLARHSLRRHLPAWRDCRRFRRRSTRRPRSTVPSQWQRFRYVTVPC